MAPDLIGFENLTLKGGPVARATAALKVARHQVRLALQDTTSWRMEAVLSDIEDQIADQLAQMAGATDDDAADLETNGEVEASRQAWLPLRAA